jgi:hypothetical protein
MLLIIWKKFLGPFKISIGDEGAKAIAEALKINTTLQWIDLGGEYVSLRV